MGEQYGYSEVWRALGRVDPILTLIPEGLANMQETVHI